MSQAIFGRYNTYAKNVFVVCLESQSNWAPVFYPGTLPCGQKDRVLSQDSAPSPSCDLGSLITRRLYLPTHHHATTIIIVTHALHIRPCSKHSACLSLTMHHSPRRSCYVIALICQTGKLTLREVKQLAPSHTSTKVAKL